MSTNLPVGVPPLGSPVSTPPIGPGPSPSNDIIPVTVEQVEPQPEPLPVAFKNRRGQQRLENITVQAIELFLAKLSETGQWYKSSELCGLSYQTIRRLKKDEPEFAIMCEEAMEAYRDSLIAEAHRRAVTGWDEPVFSQALGREIGKVRRHDGRLLELMLKRHIPEFREKFEGKLEVSGGVLVAPVAAVSLEDWAKQNQEQTYKSVSSTEVPKLPGT